MIALQRCRFAFDMPLGTRAVMAGMCTGLWAKQGKQPNLVAMGTVVRMRSDAISIERHTLLAILGSHITPAE